MKKKIVGTSIAGKQEEPKMKTVNPSAFGRRKRNRADSDTLNVALPHSASFSTSTSVANGNRKR